MLAPVEQVLADRAAANPTPLARVGLAAAAALHVALVAAAVFVPGLTEERRQPMEFVPVALVPAQALGTGRPPPPAPEPEPAAAAPEPEPEPPAPEPEPEPEPAMPPPTPAREPERRPEPRPERRPETPRRADPAPTPPSDPRPAPSSPADRGAEAGEPGDRPGSPLGSPSGTSGLGARIAGVGDPSFTYGYYLDRMLALIERNWRRPPTGDALPEVAITFRIHRDGRVGGVEVETSSGVRAFDLAGLRAVENASPLPPLPAGYRKDSLSVRLIIR